MSNVGNWKPCKDKNVFSFITTFIDSFRFITRSGVDLQQNHPRCESSEKYNNTNFKGVQPQDKGAPLIVRNLHHEKVVSMSNLRMTPKVVFHSFVRLATCKKWSCATLWIQGKEKRFSIKINSTMNVWKT